MTKRERVKAKFGGRCAYCGRELSDTFHIDHVDPIYRGWNKPADDTEANMFPACPRCNLWKKTFSIEQFRDEIAAQVNRVRRDSSGYRLAEDFGQVAPTKEQVIFYFERGEYESR